jgi:hypothetical protein
MIVLAPRAQRIAPLIRAQTGGAGDWAKLVASLLTEVARHEGGRAADWRPVIRAQIDEIFVECARDNWDGHGASSVSHHARETAKRFVSLLPVDLPNPEPAPDPDGRVALTWDFGPNRVLTISIGETDSAAYAGILGKGVKRHGLEPFRDDVAKVLIESIREVSSAR